MTRLRAVPVLLAVVVLVGTANLGAFAATGGPLLLGTSNTASKTTVLKTTGKGAALSLKSKQGKAPLKVSSSAKVTKLNADLVDGLDGDALKNRAHVYDLSVSGATDPYVIFTLPGLPAGRYLASFTISGKTTGGATDFGCFLASGTSGTLRLSVAALGTTLSGVDWFVNGSGYVDTTKPHRVICQRQGGTTTSIPGDPSYSATVSFTRLDDVTRSASSGVGAAGLRGTTR